MLFIDQGADINFLLQANDHELSLLVPGVVNKGKLRMALDRLKERVSSFVKFKI